MFPFEIITTLVTFVVGGLLKLAKLKAISKSREEEAKLRALNAEAKVTKEARDHGDEGFKITRRIIALSTVFAVIVGPLVAPYVSVYAHLFSDFGFPYIPITFGYTQLDPGLWPFTADVNVTKWFKDVQGFLITPWHTHTVSAIIGFYFGTK